MNDVSNLWEVRLSLSHARDGLIGGLKIFTCRGLRIVSENQREDSFEMISLPVAWAPRHPSSQAQCTIFHMKTHDDYFQSPTGSSSYRGRCLYKTGKCPHERAMKRDNSVHKLCELHRAKANDSQRKLDHKKKELKLVQQSYASSSSMGPSRKKPKLFVPPRRQDTIPAPPMAYFDTFHEKEFTLSSEPLCEDDVQMLVSCLLSDVDHHHQQQPKQIDISDWSEDSDLPMDFFSPDTVPFVAEPLPELESFAFDLSEAVVWESMEKLCTTSNDLC